MGFPPWLWDGGAWIAIGVSSWPQRPCRVFLSALKNPNNDAPERGQRFNKARTHE